MASAQPWADFELDAIVTDYLHMLTLELSGQRYVKSQHRAHLKTRLANRSDGSIERKHQNISAIMIALGFPYITGYKPLGNYQKLLFDILADRLTHASELNQSAEAAAKRPAVAPLEPDFSAMETPAPTKTYTGVREAGKEYVVPTRGVQRDYLALEASNQSLGRAGEKLIVKYERYRLRQAGQDRLSEQVEHVAMTRGDGLGYDILSFDRDGRERLIEVKTTAFGKQTPFYLSRNELALSQHAATQFHLYRLFEFRQRPRLFNLQGSVDSLCHLDPITYVARF